MGCRLVTHPLFYILPPCGMMSLKDLKEHHFTAGGGFKNCSFSAIVLCLGPLTQVAEYLPFKQRVAGSNPARPTRVFLEFRMRIVELEIEPSVF
jgi:hypothetical protein